MKGVGKLLHRHGWSVQVPVQRALERGEEAIIAWKEQVWPTLLASSSSGGQREFCQFEAGEPSTPARILYLLLPLPAGLFGAGGLGWPARSAVGEG